MMANRHKVLIIGIGAALAFIMMTGIHLDSQGVYYDELHQAPTAFWHLGKHPPMFNREFNDIPILNMTYSGAIKSHIYGIYLRYITGRFTVYSWRLLGILFVAAGLCGFYMLAGRYLSPSTMLLFAALLLTDTTVILTTRFDWGPTALALALRLMLIAMWLSLELGERTNWKLFGVGFIVGIAIFEKLAAVVLLGPLLLILVGSRKLGRRGLAAAFAGGLLATLPLAYANYSSYRHRYGFVSLLDIGTRQPIHLRQVMDFFYQILALGYGQSARSMVLNMDPGATWLNLEVGLTLVTIGIVSFVALKYRRANIWMRLAATMVAAYLFVGILIFMLPNATSVHHWIQVTPFQYAAIALAQNGLSGRRLSRAALMATAGLLLLMRVPNIATMERALAQGKASPTFDRSYVRLGELVAANSHEATFIEADWGTATQIYCLSNGADDVVHETFWGNDPARETRMVLETTKKNIVYVVLSGIGPEARKIVTDTVVNSPDWKEAPIENETAAALSPIQIRKFLRVHAGG